MQTALSFEQLEERVLLAGSITAMQKGGTLYITGDSADNNIHIDGTGFGSVTVNETGGGDVNGDDSDDPESYSGVTNIIVRSKDGSDAVIVDGIDIDGKLKIDLGKGESNGTQVLDSSIGGHLDIRSKATSGTMVTIDDGTSIGGEAWIRTKNGSDSVYIDNATFDWSLYINTGGDNDEVMIGGTEGGGKAVDIYNKLTILTCKGNDYINVYNTDIGGLTSFNSGSGNDMVYLEDSCVGGELFIRTCSGQDLVHLCGITADWNTKVDTGSGNDAFEYGDSFFSGHLRANGGGGTDVDMDLGGNSHGGEVWLKKFEVFLLGDGCDDGYGYGID